LAAGFFGAGAFALDLMAIILILSTVDRPAKF